MNAAPLAESSGQGLPPCGLPGPEESTLERLCATCESPGTTARLLGSAWKCLATGLPPERCIRATVPAETRALKMRAAA